MVFWYPPHLNSYSTPCPTDPLPCPEHAEMLQAKLVAALFLKDGSNEIVLQSGSQKRTFLLSSGFHVIEMDLCAGRQTLEVFRNGRRMLVGLGEMEVTSTPKDRWNLNLFVQEASSV